MGLFSWLFGSSKPDTGSFRTPVTQPKTNRFKSGPRIRWRENSYPMDAVGESNYQTALEGLTRGHNRDGHNLLIDAELLREPNNPYDTNAVAVRIGGHTVGYLPREQAVRVASQMRADGIDRATCGAKIVGGWRTNQFDKGSFGVRLAVPNWGWIDFGIGKQAPSKPAAASSAPKRKRTARPKAASNGPLKGHYIVIWGAPSDGEEAEELAQLGAHIMAGVGKSTTKVVYSGSELTPGMKNSRTYAEAQNRIAEGSILEIVSYDALLAELK